MYYCILSNIHTLQSTLYTRIILFTYTEDTAVYQSWCINMIPSLRS